MKVFGTVRFRLALWNVGVIAVVLAIFGYSLRFKIQTDLLHGVDDSLVRGQQSVATDGLPTFLIRHGIMPGACVKTSQLPNTQQTVAPAPTNAAPSLFPFSLIGLNGQPVYSDHSALDPRAIQRSLHGDMYFSTYKYAGQPARIYSFPLYERNKITYILQLSRPLEPVYHEINNITRGLLTLIPLALIIVGIGALLLTERALRPVREIVRATEGIEASDLTGRLSERGSDEFSHLAATINSMLGRVDKAFRLLQEASEQQRRFTADASHELRTPLTIIKANTSLALASDRSPEEYRRTIDSVDRAADRMGKIVQDLLYIARSDAGQLFLKSDAVNLRSVVQQAIEAIADLKGHTIKQDLMSSAVCPGDEDALIRLFTNLLQNASNYTCAGGTITARAYQHDGMNVVTVADTGIGVAPEHIDHLGERFFRVDDGRARDEGGTGLGLAICRSIVASHNGVMSIESKLGVGTIVTVTLPRIEVRNGSSTNCDGLHSKAKLTAISGEPRS